MWWFLPQIWDEMHYFFSCWIKRTGHVTTMYIKSHINAVLELNCSISLRFVDPAMTYWNVSLLSLVFPFYSCSLFISNLVTSFNKRTWIFMCTCTRGWFFIVWMKCPQRKAETACLQILSFCIIRRDFSCIYYSAVMHSMFFSNIIITVFI